jgi:lysophospholipase L1-like esterase
VIRPVANCESTLTILEKLDRWLGQTKWAVIHFNAGLHDLEHVQYEGIAPGKQTMVPVEKGPRWVSIDTYRSNLEKIVQRLKKTGARLVFATTTPVPVGARSRVPEDVARYNEAALAVMREHGVQIDDLNSAVVGSAYRFQKPQDVHFYQEGSDILADHVALSIKARLHKVAVYKNSRDRVVIGRIGSP